MPILLSSRNIRDLVTSMCTSDMLDMLTYLICLLTKRFDSR